MIVTIGLSHVHKCTPVLLTLCIAEEQAESEDLLCKESLPMLHSFCGPACKGTGRM